jgi:hypothetical protein
MLVSSKYNLPKISCRYYVEIFWDFLHYEISNTTTDQVYIISCKTVKRINIKMNLRVQQATNSNVKLK